MVMLVNFFELLVFFRSDKVGEYLFIAPAFVPKFCPPVIIGTIPTHIGHGVGGATAA